MNDIQSLQIEVNYTPGVVQNNFEEVKENLQEVMNEYKQYSVDTTNKAERKKNVATLRKGIDVVKDQKSRIRKECLIPYENFCKLADELIVIIQEPVSLIDNQIKELEDKERELKRNEIDFILNQSMGDLLELIHKSLVYNDKWENATTSLKSIKEDIESKSKEIRQAISTISMMISDKKECALESYYTDLNLAKALTIITTYENQKKEFERQAMERREKERELELEREKERVRREALAEIQREQAIREEERLKAEREQEAKKKAELEAMAVQKQSSTTIVATYKISVTQEEIEQIEMYFNSLAIEFERID